MSIRWSIVWSITAILSGCLRLSAASAQSNVSGFQNIDKVASVVESAVLFCTNKTEAAEFDRLSKMDPGDRKSATLMKASQALPEGKNDSPFSNCLIEDFKKTGWTNTGLTTIKRCIGRMTDSNTTASDCFTQECQPFSECWQKPN
jgi:3-methyladenine DNA glycosylase Tag